MQCLRKSAYTVSENTNLSYLQAELAALVKAKDETEKMMAYARNLLEDFPGE